MAGLFDQIAPQWPAPLSEEAMQALIARQVAAQRMRGVVAPPQGPFSQMPFGAAPPQEAAPPVFSGMPGPGAGGGGFSLPQIMQSLMASRQPQPAQPFAMGGQLPGGSFPPDPLQAEADAIQPGGNMSGLNRGARPFAPGAAPMVAPGIGMMSQLGGGEEPKPPAVTSLDGGAAIPMPRNDPRKNSDMSARGAAAQTPGAPMSLAPPAPFGMAAPPIAAPAQAPGGGFKLPSSAFLLALGGGLAGAPSFGQAMRRGFSNAAGVAAQDEQRDQTQKLAQNSQQGIIASLRAKGATNAEITAALSSPKMLDDVSKKYFGEGTAPPAGYQKQADGTLKFIPGGPADPAVKRELGDRQNAPQGYRWVDPKDESKGLIAIPGGPAEKITPEVSSRIGLADSFLGQLPSIRKTLTEGGATGPWDAFVAKLGQGRAGEVKRQIDSGAEALLRNLTGAGMSNTEASDYAGRYKLQPWDTVESITSKMNQLERELGFVKATVLRGRSVTPTVVNGKLTFGDMEAPSSTAAPTRTGKTKSGISYEIED